MWQSRVEIEHYSVAYFARIAAFEALKRGASVKGGAHTRRVNSSTLATLAWYPARRKSAWYTPMRFRLIKNGVAHAYDVYTV